MPEETTNTVTNETQTQTPASAEETQSTAPAQETPAQASASAEVPNVVEQPKVAKRTQGDRIAELENKLARMEAIYSLNGQNVVDVEVCADLLMKGYTIDQLKQSKPYLFNQPQAQVQSAGVVKQPPRVIAETQAPKSVSGSVSSEGFVKQLASMLTSKF